MNWEDLRTFVAVERAGTYAGAGRLLGVDSTTVARRVASLEADVGSEVLSRTRDGLVATATGQGLLLHGERMARHAQLAERDARGEAARLEGVVRIALNDESAGFLMRHLGELHREHPGIELVTIASPGISDLSRGDADLAIRFGRPGAGVPGPDAQADLRAQRVASMAISVYASRGYLERAGHPQRLAGLRGHELVVPDQSTRWMPGYEWMEANAPYNRVSLRTTTVGSALAACVAGFGLCALPGFMTLGHPDLVRLDDPDEIDSRAVWLLMPSELRRVARVRAVYDFLAGLFDTLQLDPPARAL